MNKLTDALIWPAVLMAFHFLCRSIFKYHSDLYADILFLIMTVFLFRRKVCEELKTAPDWLDILQSAAIGFSYSASLVLFLETVPGVPFLKDAAEGPALQVIFHYSGIYLLILVLMHPLAEETAFRRLLQERIREHFGIIVSVAVSVLLYAFWFWVRDGWAGALYGILSGALYALIYERTGSLPACTAAHMAGNAGILMSYMGMILSGGVLQILSLSMLVMAVLLFINLISEEAEENEN